MVYELHGIMFMCAHDLHPMTSCAGYRTDRFQNKSTAAPRSNLFRQPQKVAVKVPTSATSYLRHHVCVLTTPVDHSRKYSFGTYLEFDSVAADHITSYQSARTTPGVHWQTAGGLVMFTNHLKIAVLPRERGFFVPYSHCYDWSFRLMQRLLIC